jgi:hypothetical protein
MWLPDDIEKTRLLRNRIVATESRQQVERSDRLSERLLISNGSALGHANLSGP